MFKKALMLAALLLPACFANAHEYKGGQLLIGHPWSMELPPNAPTVAAYFIIENKGSSPDRLLSVKTPIAGEAQLHEHVQADGLMKMRQVPSVDVPAGAKVSFAPMAYHVMLLGIKDRSMLALGQRFPMTLHFEKAGDIDVQVVIQKQEPEHTH
ncbi:copper(I)-binding protein [Pseudomonas cichorii]|uniref:copper chaperone PCu(A)C n=1 Tax=Pseudomonas TaxID=286 RepID=UPI000BA42C01|nr:MULTISPECIES: copper chaperone PCu(A)C [Pseudomonas]GFM78689.1 copper(I)-binding protein [Pseudomonas cichorii]